ncbi:MAG: metal-sensitive transcriptional regulator [Dehalococcoidia bacterium]
MSTEPDFLEDMMVEETISKEVLRNRLKRIEGQIRGIERMIEGGRDCESIITQLGAVRFAIEGVGALLLRNYMRLCFDKKTTECSDIESLARAIAIWGRVHIGDKV